MVAAPSITPRSMASSLDLHEQEQLDSLKAFWRQYGNLITLALALGFAVVAGINGWNLWQRKQAENAAARVDQLEAAVQAGDAQRALAIFDDIRNNFARTAYAAQAGLSTAKLQVQKSLPDEALKSLAWVADNAADPETKTVARLHAAGVLMDKKQYPEALAQLDAAGKTEGTMAALIADRRGDVLALSGKADEARAAYQAAYAAMDAKLEYRQIVEAKLVALGGGSAKTAADAQPAAAGASK